MNAKKRKHTEEGIVQSFRVIYQAIHRHSAWVEKNCGVSASQLWAMTELYKNPGLRVSDIAKRLSIEKSTASNMLDKIQNKHLLERRRESRDQRVVTLYLTDKGNELISNLSVPTQGVLIAALEQMQIHEIEALSDCLDLLRGKFSDVGINVPHGAGEQLLNDVTSK